MNNGLAGVQMALDMMLKGETKTAKQAKGMGIVDEIVEGDLVTQAVAFAREQVSAKSRAAALRFRVPPPMKSHDQQHGASCALLEGGASVPPPGDRRCSSSASPASIPLRPAGAVRIFHQLLAARPSGAVHLFFAERELARIPGLAPAEPSRSGPRPSSAELVDASVAMVFANAGIPVRVLDVNAEQVERGRKAVADTYAGQVKKGHPGRRGEREASISFVASANELRDADLVVEAVFESMSVKKQVFAELDSAVKPGTILATNTSTLDIDELAAATSRPEKVLGLHFFAPANIMQLVEVVRGAKTGAAALTTAMALAKKLRKKGVLSGNAFGFIGNRMLFDYVREASFLLEEGATPAQVDAAIKEFGFPMGPFAMSDLSGVDMYLESATPTSGYRQSAIATRLPATERPLDRRRAPGSSATSREAASRSATRRSSASLRTGASPRHRATADRRPPRSSSVACSRW